MMKKPALLSGLAALASTCVLAASVDPLTLNWDEYLDPETEGNHTYMSEFLGCKYYVINEDMEVVEEVAGIIRRNDLPNIYDRNSFLYYFEETDRNPMFMATFFIDDYEWMKTYFELMEANPDMVLIELAGDDVYLNHIQPYVYNGWLKVIHKIWRTDAPRYAVLATLRSNDEWLDPLAYAAIDFKSYYGPEGAIEVHPQVSYARNFGYYFTPLNDADEYLPRAKGWKYSPLHHWFFVDGSAPWTYFHSLDGTWFLSHPTYHPYMFHFNSGEWVYYLEGTTYPRRWFWSPTRGWLAESELWSS